MEADRSKQPVPDAHSQRLEELGLFLEKRQDDLSAGLDDLSRRLDSALRRIGELERRLSRFEVPPARGSEGDQPFPGQPV